MMTMMTREKLCLTKGMLPKNKLGKKMITRLYVFADKDHSVF